MKDRPFHEPDPGHAAAGRELTFTALHAMADLDPTACAELMDSLDRTALQWAFNFMAEAFACVVYAGRTPEQARAAIREFVQSCEALEDAREAVDGPGTTSQRRG